MAIYESISDTGFVIGRFDPYDLEEDMVDSQVGMISLSKAGAGDFWAKIGEETGKKKGWIGDKPKKVRGQDPVVAYQKKRIDKIRMAEARRSTRMPASLRAAEMLPKSTAGKVALAAVPAALAIRYNQQASDAAERVKGAIKGGYGKTRDTRHYRPASTYYDDYLGKADSWSEKQHAKKTARIERKASRTESRTTATEALERAKARAKGVVAAAPKEGRADRAFREASRFHTLLPKSTTGKVALAAAVPTTIVATRNRFGKAAEEILDDWIEKATPTAPHPWTPFPLGPPLPGAPNKPGPTSQWPYQAPAPPKPTRKERRAAYRNATAAQRKKMTKPLSVRAQEAGAGGANWLFGARPAAGQPRAGGAAGKLGTHLGTKAEVYAPLALGAAGSAVAARQARKGAKEAARLGAQQKAAAAARNKKLAIAGVASLPLLALAANKKPVEKSDYDYYMEELEKGIWSAIKTNRAIRHVNAATGSQIPHGPGVRETFAARRQAAKAAKAQHKYGAVPQAAPQRGFWQKAGDVSQDVGRAASGAAEGFMGVKRALGMAPPPKRGLAALTPTQKVALGAAGAAGAYGGYKMYVEPKARAYQQPAM